MHAHSLAKLQLISMLILLSALYCIRSIGWKSSPLVLVIVTLPLLALSGLTFWIGWLQLYRHQAIFYPLEEYRFRISRLVGGVKTLEEYKANQGKPYLLKKNGSLNLAFGTLGALFAIIIFYIAISVLISSKA